MVIALIVAWVAIEDNLPAEFGGSSTGLSVWQDFIYGMGTALSPPFYSLIIQLVLSVLAPRSDRWGMLGVIGLVVMGLFTCIGALNEPIRNKIFNPTTLDLPKALLLSGMILIPLFIMTFGILEWSRRRRA